MKNFLLVPFIICAGFKFVAAQCVINDTTTQFFSPDTLPCIVRGVPYNQVVQISVPDSINPSQYGLPDPFPLTIDSVVIDSVKGFPQGITDTLNPSYGHLLGGSHACATVSGTTYVPTRTYSLIYYGTITLSGQPLPPYFNGDTTIAIQTLEGYPQSPFHTYLTVINEGDSCPPIATRIRAKGFSAALNTAISLYPNPNNGVFDLDLNTGGRLNCQIVVLDVTGREIYSQPIDITGTYHTTINLGQCSKGLYALQLRSAEGYATRKISIE